MFADSFLIYDTTSSGSSIDAFMYYNDEYSLMASRDYDIGDHIMYDGTLYEATGVILEGTALVIGGNIVASADDVVNYADWLTAEQVQPFDPVVDYLTFTGIAIDDLYATVSTEDDIDDWDGTFPDRWTWDTILHAKFNGNLMAGNVEYTADLVSEVRVKRRIKGTFKWKTLHIHPVSSDEDLSFAYYDRTAAANTEYEYAYVPLISGTEQYINTAEIKSEFTDVFLLDPDQIYHAILGVSNDITLNQETGVQPTVGRTYPFVIKNGMGGYYSGTLQTTWIQLVNCQWDIEGGGWYRREIDKFLTNGKTKILKDFTGNIWMCAIVNAISQDSGNGYEFPVHQMEWVEVGDVESVGDLYDNGYINTDMDRE